MACCSRASRERSMRPSRVDRIRAFALLPSLRFTCRYRTRRWWPNRTLGFRPPTGALGGSRPVRKPARHACARGSVRVLKNGAPRRKTSRIVREQYSVGWLRLDQHDVRTSLRGNAFVRLLHEPMHTNTHRLAQNPEHALVAQAGSRPVTGGNVLSQNRHHWVDHHHYVGSLLDCHVDVVGLGWPSVDIVSRSDPNW